MGFLPLAFLMGLFSSLHCAVMCGPIMLGMPFKKKNIWSATIHLFSYQFGRISTYLILGFSVGFLGSNIRVLSNQQVLGIIIGMLLIGMALLQFLPRYHQAFIKIQQSLILPLSKLLGKVLNWRCWSYFAGMINGIIPCGMVYLALATALNTGAPLEAAKFMMLFGLGTMPLLLIVSISGVFLKNYIRINTQKLLPWITLLMGMLLVLRAIELGIPFISPLMHQSYGQTIICN